jgi:hypothetical protein
VAETFPVTERLPAEMLAALRLPVADMLTALRLPVAEMLIAPRLEALRLAVLRVSVNKLPVMVTTPCNVGLTFNTVLPVPVLLVTPVPPLLTPKVP